MKTAWWHSGIFYQIVFRIDYWTWQDVPPPAAARNMDTSSLNNHTRHKNTICLLQSLSWGASSSIALSAMAVVLQVKTQFQFSWFKILLAHYCHLVQKAERRGFKPIISLKTSFLAVLLNKRENTERLLRTAGQVYDQMQTGGNVQAGCCWATSLLGKTCVTQHCPFQTIVSYKLIY